MAQNTLTQIGWSTLGQPVFFDARDNDVCVEHLQEGVLVVSRTAIILERVEPTAWELVIRLIEEARCSLSMPTLMEA
jgi:hypothetical protein